MLFDAWILHRSMSSINPLATVILFKRGEEKGETEEERQTG